MCKILALLKKKIKIYINFYMKKECFTKKECKLYMKNKKRKKNKQTPKNILSILLYLPTLKKAYIKSKKQKIF